MQKLTIIGEQEELRCSHSDSDSNEAKDEVSCT